MTNIPAIIDAILELNPGKSLGRVSLELAINPDLMRKWAHQECVPTDANCVKLADAAKMDREQVMLIAAIARSAKGPAEISETWRRLLVFYQSKKGLDAA